MDEDEVPIPQVFVSGKDELSTEPAGRVGMTLILAPETFPQVAERIGLAIAEEEQGLTGEAARRYAEAFRDGVKEAFASSQGLLDALENPPKKRNARKRP